MVAHKIISFYSKYDDKNRFLKYTIFDSDGSLDRAG